MNRIEKSELLLALHAKLEEAKAKFEEYNGTTAGNIASGYVAGISAIIQMVTDDF